MRSMLSDPIFVLKPSGSHMAETSLSEWTFGGWFKAVAKSRQDFTIDLEVAGAACRHLLTLQGSESGQVNFAYWRECCCCSFQR
jgi:hypothetical protein